MAYGVIIYEDEHDNFLSLSAEDAGKVVQNMIRAFKGEELVTLDGVLNVYSASLCKRVEKDKVKAQVRSENGKKGGAPKGNSNASKTSKNNLNSSKKQAKTSNNNNYNSNNNNNNNIRSYYPANKFNLGAIVQDYDFKALEDKKVRN